MCSHSALVWLSGYNITLSALKPGERILDVGCGTGVLTRLAAAVVGEKGQAVGIDPAPKMISIAKRMLPIEKAVPTSN